MADAARHVASLRSYAEAHAGLAGSVGGLAVMPGDVVVADENGVAVIPVARLAAVVETIPALLERERELQADIAAGHGLSRRRP